MQTTLIAVIVLLQCGLLGVGIYLKSYLQSKAKNLATHEDFEDLKNQTGATKRW